MVSRFPFFNLFYLFIVRHEFTLQLMSFTNHLEFYFLDLNDSWHHSESFMASPRQRGGLHFLLKWHEVVYSLGPAGHYSHWGWDNDQYSSLQPRMSHLSITFKRVRLRLIPDLMKPKRKTPWNLQQFMDLPPSLCEGQINCNHVSNMPSWMRYEKLSSNIKPYPII